METFSALLSICAGNSPVPGEFPAQRPVTRSFGVFFDLRLNKRLSTQSWGWWFETLLCPLWRHCNVFSPPASHIHKVYPHKICTLLCLLVVVILWCPRCIYTYSSCMMTSSNGNIFRVTGPLCGEFTGPGEFPTQRPVTRSIDVFCDLRLNKLLSKQQWGWWFETPSCSLSRQCNVRWHWSNRILIAVSVKQYWKIYENRSLLSHKKHHKARIVCMIHGMNYPPGSHFTNMD